MRLLFLLLLLANLALFAWTRWLAPSSTAVPAASAALEVPRILLVGEPSAPGGAAAGASAPEMAGEDPGQASPEAVADEATPAQEVAASRCVSVGPLTDLDSAARVTRVLLDLGYAPRQRPADGLVPAGFIVLVSGLAGPEEQAQVQRRLERGGLTDAAALPPPVGAPPAADASTAAGGAFAVSAGLFSERRRAERRADVVRRIGLTPEIEERRRNGTVYWLDLDLRNPAEPEALQAASLGDAALQILPCPEPGQAEAPIR
jgi:hypothetical protein